MKERDITGRRFGRLVAVRSLGQGESWQLRWLCRCDCGKTVAVYKNNLVSGHTRSCGCLRSDHMKALRNGKGNTALGQQGPGEKE